MVENCLSGYNSCMFAYGQVSPCCEEFEEGLKFGEILIIMVLNADREW